MNKAEIIKAGFCSVRRSPRRLVANIQSIKKSAGKTRLALTARKPLGYISVEIGGEEGVVDSFIPDGADSFDGIQIAKIRMESPSYPNPEDFKSGKDGEREYNKAVADAVQAVASPAMDQFYAAYYASIANMETTVIDTGTDLYQLARLADFGRLEQVPQLAYVQVKRAIAKLMDDGFSSHGSVIWIHHMKDKGETIENDKGKREWRASGVYEMDGCAVVNDKVQAVIELWREDLTEPSETTGRLVRFCGQIMDSRHSPDSMGLRLYDEELTFANIGKAIFAGSSDKDWV